MAQEARRSPPTTPPITLLSPLTEVVGRGARAGCGRHGARVGKAVAMPRAAIRGMAQRAAPARRRTGVSALRQLLSVPARQRVSVPLPEVRGGEGGGER